jgi:hypothetical protein
VTTVPHLLRAKGTQVNDEESEDMMWSTRIQDPFKMWHIWRTMRQLTYNKKSGHSLWLQGEKLLKLLNQSTRIGERTWWNYCCCIVVWWFVALRWSMSIRLWLVVRLSSLILLSQLGTPSFPMIFLLIETTLVEDNSCVRLFLIIRKWFRRYY